MKKINWHNPANATPPEGYRLLIPEEVDGRFNSNACPKVQMFWISGEWDSSKSHIYGTQSDTSYAVPQDTPLPEGYAVIDGEPWQMDGWTLNVPANERVAHGYSPIAKVQVKYRNGNEYEAENFKHWFGPCPEKPEVEIIGWRVVEQEKAPEPLPGTNSALRGEFGPLVAQLGRETFKSALLAKGVKKICEIPVEERADFKAHLESMLPAPEAKPMTTEEFSKEVHTWVIDLLNRTQWFLVAENQRLKSELKKAENTLRTIRSLLP